MEALACGLPVLVSDILGNKEWIIDQENGFLFETGDVDSLAKKILDVYQKRNDLTAIKKMARITAEKKANWKLNFEKLLNAYHMVLTLEKKEKIQGVPG